MASSSAAEQDVTKAEAKIIGKAKSRPRADSKTTFTHRTSGTLDSLASAFIWPVWQSGYKQRAAERRNSRPESQSRTALWVLMQTVPTPDCDVLLTLPNDADTLHWIVSCLHNRVPALGVTVRYHSNTNVYGLYLTAEFDDLLLGAEELRFKKMLASEYGGVRREFTCDDRECFENIDDASVFFSSEERATIIRHMLFSLRSQEGEQVGNVKFHEGQVIVPLLLSKGVISQLLPMHCPDECHRLYANWVLTMLSRQPLDEVRQYFGVKIALYFAYLGHYTSALLAPAVIGVVVFYLSLFSQVASDACFVGFALLNVVWAVMYLEHWKRRSAEFSHRWGTLDLPDDLLIEPRPLFHGSLEPSPITGQLQLYYPSLRRNLFCYLVSYPVMLVCLSAVFATLWACFEVEDWVRERCARDHWPAVYAHLPKVLLAICIGCFDRIYHSIAIWLNDKENHRLQEVYENNLIFKLILFQFVNSFLSLFYIAFYLQDMARLRAQLAALLVTRQVLGNITETVLPYILTKVTLFRIGKKYVKQKFFSANEPMPGREEVLHEYIKKNVVQDTQLESLRKLDVPEEDSVSQSCSAANKGSELQDEDGMEVAQTTKEVHQESAKKIEHDSSDEMQPRLASDNHEHRHKRNSSHSKKYSSGHSSHRKDEADDHGLRHRKHSTCKNTDSEESKHRHRRHGGHEDEGSEHVHLHRRQHSRTNLNDSSEHLHKHSRHRSRVREDDDRFIVPGQSGFGAQIIDDDVRYVDPVDLFGYMPEMINDRSFTNSSSASRRLGKWFAQRNNSAKNDDEEVDTNNHCGRKRTVKKQAAVMPDKKAEKEKEKDVVKKDTAGRIVKKDVIEEEEEEEMDRKVPMDQSKRISFDSEMPNARKEDQQKEADMDDLAGPSAYITDDSPILTQAELESAMPKYDGTFGDYLEMFIQFGYVILFSSAFPLAALCALVNNLIEIRSDAFKLCTTFQRPFGEIARNIGTWQSALELMSLIAILVNCALIGQSELADRLFPSVSPVHRVIYIVALEHLILGGKLLLSYAIPDVPEWIAVENARLELNRREALRTIESKEFQIPHRLSVSHRASLKQSAS